MCLLKSGILYFKNITIMQLSHLKIPSLEYFLNILKYPDSFYELRSKKEYKCHWLLYFLSFSLLKKNKHKTFVLWKFPNIYKVSSIIYVLNTQLQQWSTVCHSCIIYTSTYSPISIQLFFTVFWGKMCMYLNIQILVVQFWQMDICM